MNDRLRTSNSEIPAGLDAVPLTYRDGPAGTPGADAPQRTPNLSILIPVYNERSTVLGVITKLREVPFPALTEIIVVNDGSSDGTTEILTTMPAAPNIRVFHHPVNKGKGAAIKTAISHARGRFIVIQDADEELDPFDLLGMFEHVRRGETQVCYGSRFLGRTSQFWFRPTYWANRTLNFVCNRLNGLHLTDMNTCYKMMPIEIARQLDLVSPGFAMEPEITTKLARLGIQIMEHPVHYEPRGKEQGKKIRSSDFFRYLSAMIRFRSAPMTGASAPETHRPVTSQK